MNVNDLIQYMPCNFLFMDDPIDIDKKYFVDLQKGIEGTSGFFMGSEIIERLMDGYKIVMLQDYDEYMDNIRQSMKPILDLSAYTIEDYRVPLLSRIYVCMHHGYEHAMLVLNQAGVAWIQNDVYFTGSISVNSDYDGCVGTWRGIPVFRFWKMYADELNDRPIVFVARRPPGMS